MYLLLAVTVPSFECLEDLSLSWGAYGNQGSVTNVNSWSYPILTESETLGESHQLLQKVLTHLP